MDDLDWTQEHGLGEPLADALLTPTRIYIQECLALVKALTSAVWFISLAEDLTAIFRAFCLEAWVRLHGGSWTVPPIFDLLKRLGNLVIRHASYVQQRVGHDSYGSSRTSRDGGVFVRWANSGEVIQDSSESVVVDES